MTNKELETIMDDMFAYCADLIMKKGREYAEDETDRLEHFKAAAGLMGTTPRQALMGMFSKHIVSVSDMCMSGRHYDTERWREKLSDSINYLILLAAIIAEEEAEHATDRNTDPKRD